MAVVIASSPMGFATKNEEKDVTQKRTQPVGDPTVLLPQLREN